MRELPNTNRSSGYGETSWEDGNSSEITSRQIVKNLIDKADSVSLLTIFKHYGILINSYNSKTTCPFKSHKNGQENTPSFNYFPATNSFYCYGCKIGNMYSHGCTFVSIYEGINKEKAARKILEKFSSDVLEDYENNDLIENFSEKLELMLSFSDAVRNFHINNTDDNSFVFIEKICLTYDKLIAKHKPNNEALAKLIEELKKKIYGYK